MKKQKAGTQCSPVSQTPWTGLGSFPKHHWTVSEAFHVQNFRCWSTCAAAESPGNSKRTNVHILTLLVIFIYFRTCTSLNHFIDMKWCLIFILCMDLSSLKIRWLSLWKLMFSSYSPLCPQLPQISAPPYPPNSVSFFTAHQDVVDLWRTTALEKTNSSVSTGINCQ